MKGHRESSKTEELKEVRGAIDSLVKEIIKNLSKKLGHCLESVTLIGSYTIGKISLERPNVNFLIFTKSNISANEYLKIGEIFYNASKKYLNFFSVKVDSPPFRTGFPIGNKGLQLVLSPNVLNIIQKNDNPPFGVPLNVLEGMKSTRKIVFGSDPLEEINIKYTKKDVIRWAFFDIGIIYRNQLIRAPLSYDITEHLNLLADESLEIGKVALMWGTEIFLSEDDWKRGRHIELIKNKEKMVKFYNSIDEKLGEDAMIIVDARLNFHQYKSNEVKAYKLYNSAYNLITAVFFKILEEMRK